MPAWLITLVIKTGIPFRFAKIAAWAIIALAAILACIGVAYGIASLAQRHDDKVEQHVVKDMTLDAANRVIEADRAANAKIAEQVKQDQQNEKELQDEVGKPDPVRSVLIRMRSQQKSGHR